MSGPIAVVDTTQLGAGLALVGLAIFAIVRQVEVRLVLFTTALALGALAGQVDVILKRFLATFSDEKFVVPICTAMGFSYVLRRTGCDQHLVRMLVRPLVHVRYLLVPGTVLIGYFVNMPVVSQTSTAVAIGPVVVPILRAAGISPVTIGGSILLGCSIGGELFNPGAPELRTVIVESRKAAEISGYSPEVYTTDRCIDRLRPLNLVGLAVATTLFCVVSGWRREASPAPAAADAPVDLGVNYFKAFVPLFPLVLLYLTAPGIGLFESSISRQWLEDREGQFETRLIGAAMVIGVGVAVLTTPSAIGGAAEAFFHGAGYGFTHIISLIVVANCFGEGLKLIGLAQVLGEHMRATAALLVPTAGLLSLGFGFLCGSGMATTQSLFGFFAEPALHVGLDPAQVGAVISLGAAAGRTISPVAAVTLMTAQMSETTPLALVRRLALPVVVGMLSIIALAALRPATP
jgi:DcuC family C4-dicarboxylate transporter